MKLKRRVTSLTMALLLAVSTLPVSPTAFADDDPPAAEPARMRFVQTGFDASTGTLTMSLQVMVDETPEDDYYRSRSTDPEQKFFCNVTEGMFAFRFDERTLTPITRPASSTGYGSVDILAPTVDRVAMVTMTGSGATGESAALYDYLQNDGYGKEGPDGTLNNNGDDGVGEGWLIKHGRNQDDALSIDKAMDQSWLNTKWSGILISRKRSTGADPMADAYLQFYWNNTQYDKQTLVLDAASGAYYLTVMDLDFKCQVSGEDGTPKAAANEDFLFKNSFSVPQNATEEQAILNEFTYNGQPLAMGGAGYVERYSQSQGAGVRPKVMTKAHHYFNEPQLTNWRKDGLSATETTRMTAWGANIYSDLTGTVASVSGAPGLTFTNQDKLYTVTDFLAYLNNVFEGEAEDGTIITKAQAEFLIPSGYSSVDYAAYDIPTYAKVLEIEAAAESGDTTAWIPVSHGKNQQVALKYYINASVDANSAADYPQSDLNAFMEGLQWEFTMPVIAFNDDGSTTTLVVSYEDLTTTASPFTTDNGAAFQLTETGVEIELTGADGKTYTAHEVTFVGNVTRYECSSCGYTRAIHWQGGCPNCRRENTCEEIQGTPFCADQRKNLVGKKLWKIYDENNHYVMTTPEGVMFDMISTKISYDDPFVTSGDPEKTEEAKAPQFHLTNLAADPDSMIWYFQTTGLLGYRVTYDPQGAKRTGDFKVRLYKEDTRVPSYTEKDAVLRSGGDPFGLPQDETDAEKLYFWAGYTDLQGEGTVTKEDYIATNGVNLTGDMYDQYYILFQEEYFPELALVPTAETRAEMTRAGSTEVPFVIRRNQDVQAENNETKTGAANAYTIKYKEGMNANNVIPGEYTLQATYSAGGVEDRTPTTVTIHKPANYLDFLNVYLTGSVNVIDGTETRDAAAKTYTGNVTYRYDVPRRTKNAEGTWLAGSASAEMQLTEIANQWREDDGNPELYDVVPGLIRDGDGITWESRAAAGIGEEVQLLTALPTGVTLGRSEKRANGITYWQPNIADNKYTFTYTNSVLNNASFKVQVKMTYPKEGDVYTAIRIVTIQFTRNPQSLTDLEVEESNTHNKSMTIQVGEIPGGSMKTGDLSLVAKDQYGSNIGDIAGVVGSFKYEIVRAVDTKTGQEIPLTDPSLTNDPQKGMTYLTGNNNYQVVVMPGAPARKLYVVVKAGGTTSKEFEINVERRDNEPRTVRDFGYSWGGRNYVATIDSPKLGDTETATVSGLTVINQYGEILTEGSTQYDYTVTYSIGDNTTAAARNFVEVDPSTGVLTIKEAAPDNAQVEVVAAVRIVGKGAGERRYNATTSTTLTIKRLTSWYTQVEIDTTPLPYPVQGDGTGTLRQLKASASDQYSTELEELPADKVTWALNSVTFADGSVLNLADGGITVASGVYTARSMTMTVRGLVNLGGAATLHDQPKSITVTATAQGNAQEGATTTDTKPVEIYIAPRVPKTIAIPQNAKAFNIQLPETGQTTKVNLVAEVKDQYGIVMEAETNAMTWRIKDNASKTGFTFNAAARQVTIGNDVSLVVTGENPEPNVLRMEVLYQDENAHPGIALGPEEVPIYVRQDANAKVGTIDITGIRGEDEMTVPLPARKGYGNEGVQTYTIIKDVRDQFNLPYDATAVWAVKQVEMGAAGSRTTWTPATDNVKLTAFVKFADFDRDGKVRSGVLSVYYNETIRDELAAGHDVVVTVTATAEELDKDGNEVVGEGEIHLSLSDSVPTFAKAELDPDKDNRMGTWDTVESGGVTTVTDYPTIPQRNNAGEAETVNEFAVFATVYDQYAAPMDNTKIAKMEITQDFETGQLEFEQLKDASGKLTNEGRLKMKWRFVNNVIRVLAYPENAASVPDSTVENTLEIEVRPPQRYVFELAVLPKSDPSNEFTIPLPEWTDGEEGREDNLPPTQENVVLTNKITAQVLDSREAWMEAEARINDDPRPVWTVVQGVEGVGFPEEMDLTVDQDGTMTPIDENTEIRSENIQLQMTNRVVDVIPEGQNSVTMELLVRTTDNYSSTGFKTDDEYFTKTVLVHFTREDSRPKYFFINDVDANGDLAIELEDGSVLTALERPEAGKTTTYTVTPVVYDQYGDPMTEITVGIPNNEYHPEEVNDGATIGVTLDEAGLAVDNVRVERVEETIPVEVPRGADPVDPIVVLKGYNIYKVSYTDPGEAEPGEEPAAPEIASKDLMASFDRETGLLTVTEHYDCELLPELNFEAHYIPLNGTSPVGKKTLRIPLKEEDPRLTSVRLVRTHGNFSVTGRETEPLVDVIRVDVLDQYGKSYTGPKEIQLGWYLPEPDENGNYLPYAEFVTETAVDENTGEEITVVRELAGDELLFRTNTDNDAGYAVIELNPENFKEPAAALLRCVVTDPENPTADPIEVTELVEVERKRSPGGGAAATVTITFQPGEYGKLVGPAAIEVEAGTLITGAPSVKTVSGYGFIGWTSNGEDLVDVSLLTAENDITYYAVYRDVDLGKFLEGYSDGTVRPTLGVTRGEYITMVVRAMGGYDPDVDYGDSFNDVPHGKWYSNYIAYSKIQGISAGYPDGSYRPDQTITRAEAARLLAVAAGLALDNQDSFKDVQEGKWYSTSVAALKDSGAASGFPDGTYRPNQGITRAEAVKLVVSLTNNALDDLQKRNIKECAYCPFTDIDKSNWAYAYILRAAGVA